MRGARPSLWACTLLAALLLATVGGARAGAPLPSAAELANVKAAIERGAFSDAVDQLEAWSDHGIVHPDLSFDRGVAYLGRAESPAARRADLGQAAAAFEEAAQLDPSDDEARTAAERIRAAIAEKRTKREGGVVARPRLLRALLDLVGENVWAGLAAFGSLLLTLGLVARLFFQARPTRLAGTSVAVVGAACVALGGGMAFAGASLRARFTPAVVIVEEARLLDASGRPFVDARGPSALGEAGDRVPEGSLVHVAEARGALVRVEWGDVEAWLSSRELRRLARP